MSAETGPDTPGLTASFQSAAPLSWDGLCAQQLAERDQWLAGAIARLDPLYARMGSAGERFREEMALTSCVESVDLNLYARAAFNAHHLRNGFSNQIFYGPNVLGDERDLFLSRAHEGVHALQFHRCAATHATPFNGGTKFILCPRDGVLLEELKERDAFAKQGLLLRLSDDPAYVAAGAATWVENLRDAATTALESLAYDGSQSFLDYYRNREIGAYEGCMLSRHHDEGGFTYVRLDADDVWVLGGALGLNSFGPTPQSAAHWLDPRPLPPDEEARLAALNAKLGIDDESALPTLRQALLAAGTSKPLFMHAAMGRGRKSDLIQDQNTPKPA